MKRIILAVLALVLCGVLLADTATIDKNGNIIITTTSNSQQLITAAGATFVYSE